MTCCLYLIYKTYEKWEYDPMIVSFNQKAIPTWQIPFPAITICPESKIDDEKFSLENFKKSPYDLNKSESAQLAALYQVCDIKNDDFEEENLNYGEVLRNIANSYFERSTVSIASEEDEKFTEHFHEVMTEEGLCHTFNMLNEQDLFTKNMTNDLRYPKHEKSSNWTIYGYGENDKDDTYPFRVMGSGAKAGIYIKLKMLKRNNDNFCKNTNGFRLVLHTPDEMPQPRSLYYQIPLKTMTVMAIQPRVMSTSDDMKKYRPEDRQCSYDDENQLKYFKQYSQRNCDMENFASKFFFSINF